MPIKKYIETKEVVSLTGRSNSEIINLAQTGVLPCHKSRRGHWRFNVAAVEEYFGIQINTPAEVEERPVIRKVLPRVAATYKPEKKVILSNESLQEEVNHTS